MGENERNRQLNKSKITIDVKLKSCKKYKTFFHFHIDRFVRLKRASYESSSANVYRQKGIRKSAA